MEFTIKALDRFRNTNLKEADGIVNIGNDNKTIQKGSYYGGIGRIFRKSSTKAANNAARTEFLQSLGNAFGLDSMSQNKNGVTTFSKDFMDRLEQFLGSDFKRSDFGIAADGTVNSGKPLTQRRVSAIVKQAILASKGNYDYDTYNTKLDNVKSQIAGVTIKNGQNYIKNTAIKHFETVGKLMDFAEKELPFMIEVDTDFIPNKPIGPNNMKYLLNRNLERRHNAPSLVDIKMVEKYIHDKYHVVFNIRGNILGSNKISRFMELTDPKMQITEYLKLTIQNFAMTSINTFIDAEKVGKTMDFMTALDGNEPCIEDKTNGLHEFRHQHLPMEDAIHVTLQGEPPIATPYM